MDKTVVLAKKGGARVLHSALKSPAHQRNTGARKAKGDILLFLDADVRIGDHAIVEEVFCALRDHVGAIARSDIIFSERTWIDRLMFMMTNAVALIGPRWCGRGAFLAVRKKEFERVGGFDERRFVSEDVDLFRRIAKVGAVTCLRARIEESPRRQRRLGYPRVLASWISNAVWACFTGNSHDKEWVAIR